MIRLATTRTKAGYEVLGETARDVWAGAGVLINELARPVMFLNLPVVDGGVLAPSPGEPGYESLRFLLRSPLSWAVAGRNVYICENPNLLAIAANKLGRKSLTESAFMVSLSNHEGMAPTVPARFMVRRLDMKRLFQSGFKSVSS